VNAAPELNSGCRKDNLTGIRQHINSKAVNQSEATGNLRSTWKMN